MSVWLSAMVLRLALALEVPGGPVGRRVYVDSKKKSDRRKEKAKRKVLLGENQ